MDRRYFSVLKSWEGSAGWNSPGSPGMASVFALMTFEAGARVGKTGGCVVVTSDVSRTTVGLGVRAGGAAVSRMARKWRESVLGILSRLKSGPSGREGVGDTEKRPGLQMGSYSERSFLNYQ